MNLLYYASPTTPASQERRIRLRILRLAGIAATDNGTSRYCLQTHNREKATICTPLSRQQSDQSHS